MNDGPIVLFDGVCSLCSRSVDFILRHDRRGDFRFAPLQSPAGRALLDRHGLGGAGIESVVLIAGGTVATKSTAALRIARRLGGPWAWLALPGFLLPRAARDGVYDWIARNRFRWFGRRETCRVPTAAERARFLD